MTLASGRETQFLLGIVHRLPCILALSGHPSSAIKSPPDGLRIRKSGHGVLHSRGPFRYEPEIGTTRSSATNYVAADQTHPLSDGQRSSSGTLPHRRHQIMPHGQDCSSVTPRAESGVYRLLKTCAQAEDYQNTDQRLLDIEQQSQE